MAINRGPQRRRARGRGAPPPPPAEDEEGPPIGAVDDPDHDATLIEQVSDPAGRRARTESLSAFVPTEGLAGFPDDLEGAVTEEMQGELLRLGRELRDDVDRAVEAKVAEVMEQVEGAGQRPETFIFGALFGAVVFAAGAAVALGLTGRRD